MTLEHWLGAVAVAAGLGLAALVLARGSGSRMSMPLGALAANQVAWNAATVGTGLDPGGTWAWLGAAAAPLWTPAALWLVLLFVGQQRRFRLPLRLGWLFFGAQSLFALVALFVPAARSPGALGALALLHLAGDAPAAALALWLLWAHRREADDDERARTHLLLVALLVFAALGTTDLLADLGLSVPHLASVGSVAFNGLVLALGRRLDVFGREDAGAGRWAAALTLLFVLAAYLAVFTLFQGQVALLLVGLLSLTVGLLALGRFTAVAWTRERAALERMAGMGRFSAQLAHDLKNPLAAARGAAQVLEEELRRGASLDGQREFVGLVLEQLDRLGRVVDRYQRMAAVEPDRAPLELGALVTKVLALQGFAAGGAVQVARQFPAAPTWVIGDEVLLTSALENLVKNAVEAMPRGGTVTVRAGLLGEGEQAFLEVQDTGEGMDARAREHAFQLFFTSKATGSGLGLHFVQQVARAHGGHATLRSREGWGTVVRLRLPCIAAPLEESHG